MITLKLAQDCSVNQKMIRSGEKLLSPKHTFFSVFLLQEFNDPISFWKPYLDFMPTDFTSFPIFYTNDEISFLKGSYFLESLNQKITEMLIDYNTVLEIAPEFDVHTVEQFKKARMLVNSRLFGVTLEGKDTDAMVPFADLLNHKRPLETYWRYDFDREGFTVNSDIEILPGSELTNSYGFKSNSRLLLCYGFVLENNQANEIPITISINQDDKYYTAKAEVLKGTIFTLQIQADTREQSFDNFMYKLRIIECDTYDLLVDIIDKSEIDRIQYNYFNIKVLNKIKEIAHHKLNEYDRTLHEDQEILKDPNLTQNQKNCITVVMGEKEILIWLITMSERALEWLNTQSGSLLFTDFAKFIL